ELHADNAHLERAELPRGFARQIDDPVGVAPRASIGDANANARSVVDAHDVYPGTEREREMRRGHLRRVEAAAVGRVVPGERRPIPRRIADLRLGARLGLALS